MKALTVQQPWAAAMFWTDPKDIENRSTLWTHRGPLAIHAGQRFSVAGGRDTMIVRHPEYAAAELKFGAVIGVVDMVGAHRWDDGCCTSPWAQEPIFDYAGEPTRRPIHIQIDRPRLLGTPIACPGSLGLWDLPPDVARQIRAELLGSVTGRPTTH